MYVTSEAQVRANVSTLRNAFASRWPRVTLLFATKANANLAIRHVLTDEGVGGDCFGLGELTLSLRAGVAPEMLVLNGTGVTCEVIRRRETIDDLLTTQVVPARLVASPSGT